MRRTTDADPGRRHGRCEGQRHHVGGGEHGVKRRGDLPRSSVVWWSARSWLSQRSAERASGRDRKSSTSTSWGPTDATQEAHREPQAGQAEGHQDLLGRNRLEIALVVVVARNIAATWAPSEAPNRTVGTCSSFWNSGHPEHVDDSQAEHEDRGADQGRDQCRRPHDRKDPIAETRERAMLPVSVHWPRSGGGADQRG